MAKCLFHLWHGLVHDHVTIELNGWIYCCHDHSAANEEDLNWIDRMFSYASQAHLDFDFGIHCRDSENVRHFDTPE